MFITICAWSGLLTLALLLHVLICGDCNKGGRLFVVAQITVFIPIIGRVLGWW